MTKEDWERMMINDNEWHRYFGIDDSFMGAGDSSVGDHDKGNVQAACPAEKTDAEAAKPETEENP